MNIEDIERSTESIKREEFEGLSDAQSAYLQELEIPAEKW